jgi:hypothetical protein
MGRKEEIVGEIQSLDTKDFQKFAINFLEAEQFGEITPLPINNDLGIDARCEVENIKYGFSISIGNTKSKLISGENSDCNKISRNNLDIDKLIFVTSAKVSEQKRKGKGDSRGWIQEVKEDFGWDLECYDIRWFETKARKAEHEKLIEDELGIGPIDGDYFSDIKSEFEKVSKRNLNSEKRKLPGTSISIEREESTEIFEKLTSGENLVLTGQAGFGKSGILQHVADNWNNSPVLYMDAREYEEVSNKSELAAEFNLDGTLQSAVSRFQDGILVVVDQLDSIGGTRASNVLCEFLYDASELENVNVLCGCRKWDFENRDEFGVLEDFTSIEASGLPEEKVLEILSKKDVQPENRLVSLCRNILNLSLVVELASNSEIEERIQDQADLWETYASSLSETERKGGEWDIESGRDVYERALELAFHNIQAQHVFKNPDSREDRRLISRGVIEKDKSGYRFRHEKLENFLFAQHCFEENLKIESLLSEGIDDRYIASPLRWLAKLRKNKEPEDELIAFLDEVFEKLNFFTTSEVLREFQRGAENLSETTINHLLDRLSQREELREYFFLHLDNENWLRILHEKELLKSPDSLLVSYIENISTKVPDLTQKIILEAEVGEDDSILMQRLVYIGLKLPADKQTELLPKYKEWLHTRNKKLIKESQGSQRSQISAELVRAVEDFSDDKNEDTALEIAKILLEPLPLTFTQDRAVYEGNIGLDSYGSYPLKERIKDWARGPLNDQIGQLLEILDKSLKETIEIEKEIGLHNRVNVLADRKPTSLKETLIHSIKYINEVEWSEDETREFRQQHLKEYLESNSLAVRKLGIFLLSSEPEENKDLISRFLVIESIEQNLETTKIHLRLLKRGFEHLKDEEKEKLIEWIRSGPPREYSYDQKGEDRWKLERLYLLREFLDDKNELEDLIEEYGEPYPLDKRFKSGYISQRGPQDKSKLENLNASELFELCVEWEPSQEDSEDMFTEYSKVGFAREIKEIMASSPDKYTEELSKLKSTDPIYASYALQGIQEALDDEVVINWRPILSECLDSQGKWDPEIRLELCKLVRKGLFKNRMKAKQSADEFRDTLKEFLNQEIGDYKETQSHESVAYADNSGIYHAEQHSISAAALDGLIQLEIVEGLDNGELKTDYEMSDSFRETLEDKLEDENKNYHNILGSRTLDLYYLDEKWLSDNLGDIIPVEPKNELSWVSGHRLIVRGAGPLNSKNFQLLKPYYLSLFENTAQLKKHSTMFRRLTQIAVFSYLVCDNPLDDEDEEHLTRKFFSEVNNSKASVFPEIISNSEKNVIMDNWDKIKELWRWRLEEASKDEKRPEFSFFMEMLWNIKDSVNIEDHLSLLLETSKHIESKGSHYLEDYLEAKAEDHPLLVMKIYYELHQHRLRRSKTETAMNILEISMRHGGEAKKKAIEIAELKAKDTQEMSYRNLIKKYT